MNKNDSGAVHGYSPAPQTSTQQYPVQTQQQYQQQYPSQIQPQYQQMPMQQYQQQYPMQAQLQYQQMPMQQYQQQYPSQAQPQPTDFQPGAEAMLQQSDQSSKGFVAFFKKRNWMLLVGAVLCTIWLLISYTIIGDALAAAPTGDTMEEIGQAMGTAIGAAMTIPFFIIAFVGQVFNWTGWLFSRRGLALTAAILYCVSLLFGFSYGLGIIPCAVLAFIGFAQLKKKN